MTQHRNLDTGNVLPAGFLDALEETIGTYASPNLRLSASGTTALQIAAGTGNAQRSIAIQGQWRFITAATAATAPAQAAGSYPIYLVSQANNTAQEDGGTFNYAFSLKLSTTPTGTGSEAISIQIGTYDWDGTAIKSWYQTLPAMTKREIYGIEWALGGIIQTSDFIIPRQVTLDTNRQQKRIVHITTKSNAGTGTITLHRSNGVGAESPLVVGIGASTTWSTTQPSLWLANEDHIRPVFTAATSLSDVALYLGIESTTQLG